MERRGLNIRKWFLGIALPFLRRLPLPVGLAGDRRGIGRIEYDLFPELRAAFDAAVGRTPEQKLGCTWDVANGQPAALWQPGPVPDP